ncbi:MBOAT family protein [Ruminococcaceae bacterium OttesenSCG-928-A11]|nr:MBOAT family protein [Ruminococcaceae bacterium OttesenSCG-928-A11]
MSFVSLAFLILFVVTYALCRVFKGRTQRHIILLIASYVFYGYWDIRFLLLLIGQTFISYALALKIESETNRRSARLLCAVGVSCSLLILGFFKYFNFFIESASRLLGMAEFSALNIILPVGISFYTFQALSYLLDVYRGKLHARRSFVKISLYITFFPQLVAGPIVRAETFLPQLDHDQVMTKGNLLEGIQIFLFGLVKKVVIADRLALCVDAVFDAPASYNGLSIMLAVIAYSIQIYCDFSGYSDMAIGVARVFDFELCRNFDMPYISKNPTEFWRRWHISLSQWLRDYLYISIGGNRKGKARTYINLMVTMLLGGLWHGANWTFVVWGGLHGLALVVHKFFVEARQQQGLAVKGKVPRAVITGLSVLATYIFTCVCWVFFRAETVPDAMSILGRMLTNAPGVAYYYVFIPIFVLVIGVAFVMGMVRNAWSGYYPVLDIGKFQGQFIVAFVVFMTLIFFYAGDTAFIYFQF